MDPEDERYYRYNPKFFNDYVENRGKVDLARITTTHQPDMAPLWMDVVDQGVRLAPSGIQAKWQNLRPFILEPGDSAKIRAAADAWRAEGGSGGSGSLVMRLNDWKNEIHDTIADLRRKWDDPAAEALESYLVHEVDLVCFEALENRCNEISDALHLLADAHDALQESIKDAFENSRLGVTASVLVGVGGVGFTWLSGGAGAPLASAIAVATVGPVVSGFVTFIASAWDIYEEFGRECEGSLDRLKVDLKALGSGHGTWPRPWNA